MRIQSTVTSLVPLVRSLAIGRIWAAMVAVSVRGHLSSVDVVANLVRVPLDPVEVRRAGVDAREGIFGGRAAVVGAGP